MKQVKAMNSVGDCAVRTRSIPKPLILGRLHEDIQLDANATGPPQNQVHLFFLQPLDSSKTNHLHGKTPLTLGDLDGPDRSASRSVQEGLWLVCFASVVGVPRSST